jgi:hypothetical protein
MADTNPYADEILKIDAQILQTRANIARDQALLASGQGDSRILNIQIQSGLDNIAALQQLKDTVWLPAYNNWNTSRLQPPASSGDVVGNANQARDENANAARPVIGQQVVQPDGRITPAGGGSGTNAQKTPTTESNPTTGTNGVIKTAAQTQAINSQSNRATAGAGQGNANFDANDPRRTDTGGPGAAAPGDNNTPPSPSVVINRLNFLYDSKNHFISPRANILDNYYSYTYSLSWYLVNPADYNNTIQKIRANLSGSYLLARSGGITAANNIPELGIGTGYEVDPYTTPSRNPYFNLDYYLDNLNIETSYGNGIDTGGPIQFLNISFTVTEPNGLTLPKNLYSAVNNLYAGLAGNDPAKTNYAAGMYCMAIKFYGYNEQGQLVQPITNGVGTTDPNAVVEKFIFFQLANFEYSMASKAVEYKITGAAPSTAIGFSVSRGSIPINAQFTGRTVKDVLVGQIQQQTASQTAGDNTRNGRPIESSPPPNSSIDPNENPNAVNNNGTMVGAGGP